MINFLKNIYSVLFLIGEQDLFDPKKYRFISGLTGRAYYVLADNPKQARALLALENPFEVFVQDIRSGNFWHIN